MSNELLFWPLSGPFGSAGTSRDFGYSLSSLVPLLVGAPVKCPGRGALGEDC